MKHFLSFCFALCSIVLAAFNVTPTFDGTPLKIPQEEHFKAYKPAQTTHAVVNHVLFSPGNLPERISIPTPEVIELEQPVNDDNMDMENLKLNELLYKDLEPDNAI